MKIGFFILTKEPSDNVIIFANQLQEFIETYVIVDNNDFVNPYNFKNLIFIDDDKCTKEGFYDVNYVIKKKSKVSAWDKVLYLLCKVLTDIDYCWIVEDDVFIPSINSVLEMTTKYFNNKNDIIVSGDISKLSEPKWFHWKRFPKNLKFTDEKLYHSMVPAIGVSRNMLKMVDKHVKKYKRLFFLEILFNTLAHKHNLKIKIAPEFENTIVWRHDWTYEDILKCKECWYHPIKNQEVQILFRQLIHISPIN